MDGGSCHIRQLDRCVDDSKGDSALVVHVVWASRAPVAAMSRDVFVHPHVTVTTLVKSDGLKDLRCEPME